jgi:hypothetical protein
MGKEIAWVQVGTTGDVPFTDNELREIRDRLEGHFDETDYHLLVVGEEISLFDLDDLQEKVERVEELVEKSKQ